MSVHHPTSPTALFTFDDLYARELVGLYEPWQADRAPAPQLLALNRPLAAELGIDADALASSDGVDVLVGNSVVEGSVPIAMAYAGHQFGNYSPRLGDGRALLLGEVIDDAGRRRDVHLKGSGRTRFARGGDGKAAVGPMLREYVIGEAMHALGIASTRALAVVATGERIARDTGMVPGAVLVRVASSHLRVGTFQYAAATGDLDLLRRLADHAIARHHPDVADEANPVLAFYERVVASQAELVASWMHVGFVHGVMNTDNTTISGETIDYGPCAFIDRFDLETVFSSIDHGGRYAYGNQPRVLQWNLARLAESLLPLLADDTDTAVALATEVLHGFGDRYLGAWRRGMRAKLGAPAASDEFLDGVTVLLQEHRVDHTLFFRRLGSVLRGDTAPMSALFADLSAVDGWLDSWLALVPSEPAQRARLADELDRVNPLYIPRNHQVESALEAATGGEMSPFEALVDVVTQPFDERPGLEASAVGAPDAAPYRTFCGT